MSILLSIIIVVSLFAIVPVEAETLEPSTWTGIQDKIDSEETFVVVLRCDLTADSDDVFLTVESGKNVTLDLNGYTLSRGCVSSQEKGNVAVVKSGGVLTVKDSSGYNSGVITGGFSTNGAAFINEGTLNIESGTISMNSAAEKGGAIYNKGTLTVSGGRITNNSSKDGGGIYNETTGTVTLCGSAEVSANKTSYYGGGGISNHGVLTISENARVVRNYGYTNGGGIWSSGTTALTGGSVAENSATKAGSGICNEGTLSIQGMIKVSNNMGDDVFLGSGKTITVADEIEQGSRIGVTSAVEKSVITSGYGEHNSAEPSEFFYENGIDSAAVVKSDGEAKLNTDGVAYVERSWDEPSRSVPKLLRHCNNYISDSGSLGQLGGNNWYVVRGKINVSSRADNNGTANLILCDGAEIRFESGIQNLQSSDSVLNIYAQQESTGKLSAKGGYSRSAIGSTNEGEKSGKVNIFGGIISTDQGGNTIGGESNIGGCNKSAAGEIRIYGAEVNSVAIGCGPDSSEDTSVFIGIYNSKITGAIHNGAGVLDFYNSTLDASGNLTWDAAEIGGYSGCKRVGDINIVNSYIEACTKIGKGAAIGSNEDCDCGNINIINSTVNAQSVIDNIYGKGYGAAIGGGKNGRGGNITIDHSTVVAAAITSAAIGGGENCSGGSVSITDSVVMTSASEGGAGIGGGDDGHGGNIDITRSYVYSKTESGDGVSVSGSSYEKAAYSMAFELMSRMVNGVEGGGSQVAYYHAGFMVAYYLTLLFAPTHGGAGIGGGDSGDSGTINITDSVIDSSAGDYAAGIGGGDEAKKMETISIIDSTVTASSESEGAGIGGGNDVSNNEIIITGSDVTATGGKYASGIGGGDDGDGGTINITRSTVNSTGGKDAAGIGGGEGGDGGTIEITKSNVIAKGEHYGAGIGNGESGDVTDVKIYAGCTVEATAGDSGYASAIGFGDYLVNSYLDVSVYIDDGLAVTAGKSSSDAVSYKGNDRYDAVCNSKYAKIHPCEHTNTEIRYESSAFHRHYCTDCNHYIGEFEEHTWNADNVCTVCGGSAVMRTLSFIEKNSAGETVTTDIELPKYTEYTLPECTNVPEGMDFIGWQDESSGKYYSAGSSYLTTGGIMRAVYLQVVQAEFIDGGGNLWTVQARRLSSEVGYLPAGWYVADSDVDYSALVDETIQTSGNVNLILADGVIVTIDNGGTRPLEAVNKLARLTIYGQTAQSGVLKCEQGSVTLGSLILNGGNFISGSLGVSAGAEFVNGSFTVNSFSCLNSFKVSGGNIDINNYFTNVDNIIGWTKPTDSVRFGNLRIPGKGSLSVAEGQAFTDGTNIYSGTLTPEQVSAINNKTLTPYMIHHYGEPEWIWSGDNENASAVFKCTDEGCDYQEEVDADVELEIKPDRTVYTAAVAHLGETFTASKTVFPDGFGEALAGHSISLEGDIGVNFYMELSDDIIGSDTAYMEFTVPKDSGAEVQKVYVKDVEPTVMDGVNYYVFKCHVAATEMTLDISAQMHDGDKSGAEYPYSVKDYADYLLAHYDLPEFANAVPLVKAMLSYGAYSQLYFGKYTAKPANESLSDGEKTLGELNTAVSDFSASDLPEGTSFEGATLTLKSETALSLFFESSEELEFSCEGYDVEKAAYGRYQVARIGGIKSGDIGKSITLTVNRTGSVSYSPLNYCKKVIEDETQDVKLKNVVKALWLYWEAADEYFD